MAEEKLAKVDSKKMLKELADKKVKVRFAERKQVKIVKETKYYKVGRVINPHVTWADQLIKDGIAKATK